MKQLLLTLAAAILLAGSAFAQKPGDDKAPAATATPTEKAAAKDARKTKGKSVAQASQPGDDRPATTAKKASKSERKEASAARKSEGAKVSKQPKEAAGPN